MLNGTLLKDTLQKKNISISKISEMLDIDTSTFYRKIKNNSFEIRQADKIVKILGLNSLEATKIFFAQFVA